MQTDDLIADMTLDLRAVRRGAFYGALFAPIAVGAMVSVAIMLAWLGPRPDLSTAMATASFWMKFAYTLILAGIGLALFERVGRPGVRVDMSAGAYVAAVVIMLLLGAADIVLLQQGQRLSALLGHTYRLCPWRIVVIGAPVLVGALFGLRRAAPTRPALAGAAAGLCAGAIGAWIYSFACDESSAIFVSVWYTLGIATVGALGALAGRFSLKW